MNSLAKIDRFYFMFGAVLLALAIVVTLTLRGIFGSLNKATEVDDEGLEQSTLHLSETKLNEALEIAKKREVVRLELP